MPKTRILIITTTLIIIIVAIAMATAGSLVSSKKEQANSDAITAIETLNVSIFNDSAATMPCSSFNWESLQPGLNVTDTIYVKNTGNTIETLHMNSTDWNPASTTSVLTLTWDKENNILPVGAVTPAKLTLTAAQNTGNLTAFNFKIIIEGSP